VTVTIFFYIIFCDATLLVLGCNITRLHQSSGSILSPQYPGYYTNNARCIWRLRVPRGHVIRLEFQYFDLEYNPRCSNDYLEVRDGLSAISTPIGRFCGQSFPTSIESTGREMLITFISNEQITRGGFRAQYWARIGKLLKSPWKRRLLFEVELRFNEVRLHSKT